MSTSAVIFMLSTWTAVVPLAAFCFWKAMIKEMKKRT
jgi:hypothetical protein